MTAIDEKFKYWKKLYLMFGGEFSWSAWAMIKTDGYNSDTHGHPTNNEVPYITRQLRPDDVYYTFNQQFYDILEKDTK